MLMHDVPMKKPGTYNVTFKITTGRDFIRINRLRLMDGNRCIVSEDTPREANIWIVKTSLDEYHTGS